MLSCDEFINQAVIGKCKIGEFSNLKNINSFSMAGFFQENNNTNKKRITILTPEMTISPYNKFTLDEKYGKRNVLYLKITEDKGMQKLLNDVLIPIDNLLESQEVKNLVFPNTNKQKYYSGIAKDKKKIHFKIYDMKLTIVDNNNNISDFIINQNNINDINKYLTYKSRVKLILNVDKIWKSTSNMHYGVRIVCNHFLILNVANSSDNILQKYTITDDYDIQNNGENNEEIDI
jgi:hypothetical protein